ncbi:hypothetical protein predicted by Glimmer/Critica [Bdellovibrio bacteriovorus HD100]|uniref:Uncharacterized protein n=1 Tax=Bdellovibrio bacteriovorus (strain ATCC 15356 / DSM 50701 / NCIMB 9529 / HD100) TaxID=264462 RepID=Q6MKW6_BDEBA|nr:hypothetical protein predicted by Glimmer/Critica [Bdellovibrio bacteriovorus HD100]
MGGSSGGWVSYEFCFSLVDANGFAVVEGFVFDVVGFVVGYDVFHCWGFWVVGTIVWGYAKINEPEAFPS